jgi:cyclopropane fatty-acyl-phospholipid synthase-like methyltransferase
VRSESRHSLFRKFWLRVVASNIHYTSSYTKFDRMYLLRDPWHLGSSGEEHRYKETNRAIRQNLTAVNSILEIGCGEGHQSIYLKTVCGDLTGLDVSRRALWRAQRRCPEMRAILGDMYTDQLKENIPFDLVVACEVLYYMKDVPAALRRMRTLGRHVLVTYFEGEMERLDPIVLTAYGCQSETIEWLNQRWRIAWFSGGSC